LATKNLVSDHALNQRRRRIAEKTGGGIEYRRRRKGVKTRVEETEKRVFRLRILTICLGRGLQSECSCSFLVCRTCTLPLCFNISFGYLVLHLSRHSLRVYFVVCVIRCTACGVYVCVIQSFDAAFRRKR